MNRRLAVLFSVALVAAGARAGADDAPPPPPNILLVTLDTLRPDALGWVAGRNETPALDRLALAGVRFPAAVSPVPLTLPAHTSMLTGLVPRRHGVRDNGQVLPRGVPTLAEELRSAGWSTAAFVSGYPLRRLFGLARGFDVYSDELPVGAEGWNERPAPDTLAAARRWLAGVRGPWFLWIHLYEPHDPYAPPPAFRRPGPRGAYDGEVAFADSALAEILAETATANTLTLFAGDHGESLGEHGEPMHGFFLYDSTVLVPLVVRWPGHLAPRLSCEPARLVDLAPTILDLVGVPPPPGLDGRSLVPHLLGDPAPLPAADLETRFPWLAYGWSPLEARRERDWKLVLAPRSELYDLRADPDERCDLSDSARRVAARLAADLRESDRLPPATSSAVADPEALARLRSLGYVGGGGSGREPPAGLADPKDRLELRDRLSEAESALRAGRLVEALAGFAAVLEVEPDNLFALLRSGVAWMKMGRPREAIPRLERAVAVDPDQAEARDALADALVRGGRAADSVPQWLEVLRLQPERVAAWANLATVLGGLGRTGEALAAISRAVEIEPANPQLLGNLARIQQQAGQAAEAAATRERLRALTAAKPPAR